MKDYLELCKPRIAVLSAATAFFGYHMAQGEAGLRLIGAVLGTALSACACGCLNQFLEREPDSKMIRTRGRPLPAGRLKPGRALAFGLALAGTGIFVLALTTNSLAPALAAFTLALYLLVYTPLKGRTPHHTWLGAVAGAMPPLIGWAAAKGSLEPQSFILFAIQFLWQIPHFLALFWIHREDYARAGFKVMPVADPSGTLTAFQISLYSFAMIPASLLPSLSGLTGPAYSAGALILGTAYLGLGMRASWTLAVLDTRRLFWASLAYLPLLFIMLILGGV